MTTPLTPIRERLAAIYSTVAYSRSAEADKTREALLLAESLADTLERERRAARAVTDWYFGPNALDGTGAGFAAMSNLLAILEGARATDDEGRERG